MEIRSLGGAHSARAPSSAGLCRRWVPARGSKSRRSSSKRRDSGGRSRGVLSELTRANESSRCASHNSSSVPEGSSRLYILRTNCPQKVVESAPIGFCVQISLHRHALLLLIIACAQLHFSYSISLSLSRSLSISLSLSLYLSLYLSISRRRIVSHSRALEYRQRTGEEYVL